MSAITAPAPPAREAPPLTAQLAQAIAARHGRPRSFGDGEAEAFAPAVLEKARLCLLDFLACALEARNLPWSRQAAALAEATGPCSIVGRRDRALAADAAFANAVAGLGLVREDMHAGAVAHLGVVVWPAVLALAEARECRLGAALDAAVIGYEVGAKLGRAMVTPEFSRYFRPTGFIGPAAAAAAGAALLRLDAARTGSALGLAANMASGLNQWPHSGADDMFFHPGLAVRNGLTALRLAELGAHGSPGALDGAAGLLTAMRPDHAPPPITLFAEAPEILSVFFKPVPVCNFAQTPALAAIDLVRTDTPNPDAIRGVTVRVSRAARLYPGCDHAGPFARVLQAKMSIQYAVAEALLRGRIDEASYGALHDARRLALAARIEVVADDDLTAAFPGRQGARVEVRLEDGRRLARSLADVVAADAERVRARFHAAAIDALETQDAATGIAAAIDGPADGAVAALMALTRG